MYSTHNTYNYKCRDKIPLSEHNSNKKKLLRSPETFNGVMCGNQHWCAILIG